MDLPLSKESPSPVLDSSAVLAELETVLASRVFARSPNLAGILQFICTTTVEGRAHEIKEYTVAVQALKRDPSFDPSRDSIVRVEVSRLRKRLTEYYRTEGATHSIQIELPETGYLPRFVHRALRLCPHQWINHEPRRLRSRGKVGVSFRGFWRAPGF